MKSVKILIAVMIMGLGAHAQFPTVDSVKRYIDKYINNNATNAFQNMRLNTALKALASQIDSSNARIVGGTRVVDSMYVPNDSTLRFVIKNTATGASATYTLPINATGGGGPGDTSFLNNYYVQIGDSVLIYKDSTLPGPGTFAAPITAKASKIVPNVYNVQEYGILPNGTDQTAAFNALLITVFNAGGGTIQFNRGTYLFSGKIKTPYINDNPTYPLQPYMRAIRILGTGSDACGIVYYLPHGSTTFNMTYTGTPAKIDTRGAGNLEITGIAFINTNSATDSTPFIHTTCTSLFIHHNSFAGAGTGYDQSITDAILLGGFTDVVDSTVNSGYQGYGTTIRENNFHKIRRGVYGRTFANAVNIESNNWWNSCGANTNAAAIEFLGQPDNACAGNTITNNLFELPSYKYGIKLRYSTGDNLVGNSFWDRSGYNIWPIYLGTGAEFNTISENFTSGMSTSVFDSTGNNTILSSFAGGTTKIPNNLEVGTNLVKKGGGEGVKVQDDYGNQHLWNTQGSAVSGGAATMSMEYRPFGAAAEVLERIYRPSTAGVYWILGDNATSYVRLQSGLGDFHVNQAVGKTLWLGEDGAINQYITGGVLTSRNKPILYSTVPHGLITGHNLVCRDLVDSLLGTVSGGGGLWSISSGSNIYHNPGNVGITTSATPRGNLDVWGNMYVGVTGSTPAIINSNDGFYINAEADGGTSDRSVHLAYGRTGSTSGTEMALFDNTGTTLSSKLTVTGTVEPLITQTNGGGTWNLGVGAGNQFASTIFFGAYGTPTATNWDWKVFPGGDFQAKNSFIANIYQSPVTGLGNASIIEWVNAGGTANGTAKIGLSYPSGNQTTKAYTGGTGSFLVANNAETTLFSVDTSATTGIKRLKGISPAPTIAAGTGAGTSPTISISGTDLAGEISLTTGTAPAANVTIATITFNGTFASTPFVIISPSSAAAADANVYVVRVSATQFQIAVTATALTAATAYKWTYISAQ